MKLIQRLISATLLGLALVSSQAMAAEPINTLERSGVWGYKPNGVAIRGYDTVAYFTRGAPVEGKDEFSTEWQGATWKFSSDEHLKLFEADPEKYAPQYGGYCAYGVSQDYLVKIEPDNWSIVNDKLYLNYNDKVQRQWEDDIPEFIKLADQKISSLLAE